MAQQLAQVFIGIQSHLNQISSHKHQCAYITKIFPIFDDNPKTSFGFILNDSFFLV